MSGHIGSPVSLVSSLLGFFYVKMFFKLSFFWSNPSRTTLFRQTTRDKDIDVWHRKSRYDLFEMKTLWMPSKTNHKWLFYRYSLRMSYRLAPNHDESQTDAPTDGPNDELTDRPTERPTDWRTDGRTDGLTDGLTDRPIDRPDLGSKELHVDDKEYIAPAGPPSFSDFICCLDPF